MSVRPNHKIIKLDLDRITQNENSRLNYNEADLSELMHSMKLNGLLEPIGVWPIEGEETSDGAPIYEVVYGNRRFMAAQKLGWADIDAMEIDIDNENNRDILNLTENLKRRNTTVSEEGRMFTVLQGRGMSVKEIATRLDVNAARVQNAINVVTDLPESIQKKIINVSPGGQSRKEGQISATAAHAVMTAASRLKLGKEKKKELLEFAAQKEISAAHIVQAAALIEEGSEVEDAISRVEHLKRVTLHLFISEERRQKLERKYKKTINSILYDRLESLNLGVKRFSEKRMQYRAVSQRRRNEVDLKRERANKIRIRRQGEAASKLSEAV